MLCFAAYLTLAQDIQRQLNFKSDDFTYGCVLPEMIATKDSLPLGIKLNRLLKKTTPICFADSHFLTDGVRGRVPDVERFWQEAELGDELIKCGYATHLLFDREFIETFCPRMGIADPAEFLENFTELDRNCVNRYLVDRDSFDLTRASRVLYSDHQNIPIDSKRRRQCLQSLNAAFPGDEWMAQCTIKDDFRKFIGNHMVAAFMNDKQCYSVVAPLRRRQQWTQFGR